jgi:hypothetical protein
MARQVAFIGENQTEPYVFGFDVNLYGNDFTFIPKSVYEKGFVADGKQYYLPGVLNQEFNQAFQPYAKPFSVDEVQKIAPNFKSDYEKSAFDDKQGYLVPTDLSQTYLSKFNTYDIGENKDGFVFGGITGLATNEQGQRYFNVAASGKPNAAATATADGQVLGNWYDPGKKERWYESPLGMVGIGLIGLGGLGLAGIGPLAGGGAAAGGAAGIVGTPGVSTIFPVAAPVAPTVTTLAPIATAVPAAQLAFPGLEVAPTFTPAPGSLQAALPGLGVETAASAAPFTAVPGSFQAALPALGIASAPSLAGNLATSAGSGISAMDGLRIANMAQGLLGAGQNPIVPQQQGLPQSGRSQGVDYSGLLSLLQLQAKTPGVSSLTAPAQLRQIYQPTLLPNVLSLLG